MTRFVFVIGGVMSGIGKGVTVAALARAVQNRGFSVSAVKIDPYINVDAGTMNPVEHGEVFVTADGMECDQDIGTYERFLDKDIPGINSITTGQIFQEVILRERRLEYGGHCVEVVPDIPNEIIRRLKRSAKRLHADILFIEIGGTAGEYQNILYLEAARLLRHQYPHQVAIVLVSYLPIPYALREMKTKPTQQAVHALQAAGLQPDFIVCRAAQPVDIPRKQKLSLLCNVDEKHVISAPNRPSVYEMPEQFEKEQFTERLLKKLGMSVKKPRPSRARPWRERIVRAQKAAQGVHIGIAGKYFATGNFILQDVYISVIEAIKHAAGELKLKPHIHWLDTEIYEKKSRALGELSSLDGIIVPGGFGSRGVEGKMRTIQYARTNKVPYLGLCYGMQLAAIEFARNVLGLKNAHTTEIDPKTPDPVIHVMPEQRRLVHEKKYGGSMRLGVYECELKKRTIAALSYNVKRVSERHRHRYEFNNAYQEIFEKRGMMVAGWNPERRLVEILELKNHPFFVGTQFHPELQSRFLRPHPLYTAFLKAAAKRQNKKSSP